MKSVGLIGHPIAHSLSPVIQNAAFAKHGREERYELWDTDASQLEARVRGLCGDDFLGANVTVPYKQAVVPYLDRLDSLAEQTGAVNTIVNQGGRLVGYNTDVTGFEQALAASGFATEGTRAAVLGAGGAARAVGLVLVRGRAAGIDLCDIDLERARELAQHLRSLSEEDASAVSGEGGSGTEPRPYASPSTVVRAHAPSDAAFGEAVTNCRLLVNCTPTGTRHSQLEGKTPLDPDAIPADALVFDLVYNPPLTPLLAAAQARGAQAVGGLSMLVYQAAASFKLWTGLDAPVDVMMAAAQRALDTAD
jgi:shikimate dehydrogenase